MRNVSSDCAEYDRRFENSQLAHLLDRESAEPESFSDADEIDEDFEPADYHGVFEYYEDPNEDD